MKNLSVKTKRFIALMTAAVMFISVIIIHPVAKETFAETTISMDSPADPAPSDPSDPSDPTDPSDPSDSVDPTDPTDPVDPTDPTDPSDPTDPVDPPTDPDDPTDSDDPTNPNPDPDDNDNPAQLDSVFFFQFRTVPEPADPGDDYFPGKLEIDEYNEARKQEIFMRGVTIVDEKGSDVTEKVQVEITAIDADYNSFFPGGVFPEDRGNYIATYQGTYQGVDFTATREVLLPMWAVMTNSWTEADDFLRLKYWIENADGPAAITIHPSTASVTEDHTTGTYKITSGDSVVFISSIDVPAGRTVTLSGASPVRLEQNVTTRHFNVEGSGTLTLENNLVLTRTDNLKQKDDNTGRGGGIYVHGNGILHLNGAEISGNRLLDANFGAVLNNGTFTMTSGKINDNKNDNFPSRGGGVRNEENASFTMNGGEISENVSLGGAGVWNNGAFTMNDGSITGNLGMEGIGVTNFGTFNMHGGEISRNIPNSDTNIGLGINNHSDATFNMYDGAKIYGHNIIPPNTSSWTGGGVTTRGTFNMYGGEIFNNSAGTDGTRSSNHQGGGVSVNGGTFTMDGGKIWGNESIGSDGGGIYFSSGNLIIHNGEITNNTTNRNGGGIYATNFNNLTIAQGVIFNGNTAAEAYWVEKSGAINYNPGWMGSWNPQQIMDLTDPAKSGTVLADKPFSDPPNPDVNQPFGYIFNNYDINYVGNSNNSSYPFPHTVIYMSQDAEYHREIVPDGERATKPTDPNPPSGFRFDGWYTAEIGGSQWNFNTPITQNVILYAHLIDERDPLFPDGFNNVIYVPEEAIGITGGITEVFLLKEARLTATDYLGGNLYNYSTNAGFANLTLTFNQVSPAAQSNVSFNSIQWLRDEVFEMTVRVTDAAHGNRTNQMDIIIVVTPMWKVTFEAEDGTSIGEVLRLPSASTVTAPSPNPEKPGYRFNGWIKDGTVNVLKVNGLGNLTNHEVYEDETFRPHFVDADAPIIEALPEITVSEDDNPTLDDLLREAEVIVKDGDGNVIYDAAEDDDYTQIPGLEVVIRDKETGEIVDIDDIEWDSDKEYVLEITYTDPDTGLSAEETVTIKVLPGDDDDDGKPSIDGKDEITLPDDDKPSLEDLLNDAEIIAKDKDGNDIPLEDLEVIFRDEEGNEYTYDDLPWDNGDEYEMIVKVPDSDEEHIVIVKVLARPVIDAQPVIYVTEGSRPTVASLLAMAEVVVTEYDGTHLFHWETESLQRISVLEASFSGYESLDEIEWKRGFEEAMTLDAVSPNTQYAADAKAVIIKVAYEDDVTTGGGGDSSLPDPDPASPFQPPYVPPVTPPSGDDDDSDGNTDTGQPGTEAPGTDNNGGDNTPDGDSDTTTPPAPPNDDNSQPEQDRPQVRVETNENGSPRVFRLVNGEYKESTMVYLDDYDVWLELDEDGIPLGVWYQNDDGEWIFDDNIPLGQMPQTGIVNAMPVVWALSLAGMVLLLAGLFVKTRKRGVLKV